jgi:glycosyltransferase involved in cell wall biosynthesis
MKPSPTAARVVHLLEALEPGGLERTVIDLAAAQRAIGLDAGIFCIFDEGSLAADAAALGIPVAAGRKARGNDAGWLLRFRRHACTQPGTIVHTHNPVANYLAATSLLGTSVPIVNTAHDLGHRFVTAKVRRLYKLSLLRTTTLVAVSDASRDAYRAKGIVTGREIDVVPNGIPLPRSLVASERAQARSRLPGVVESTLVFGSTGRLVPLKNHALLLRAFAQVSREMPAARLIIIGDGPLRGELEQLAGSLRIAERTWFTGFRGDARQLVEGFDVYVQSSDTEGHSIALLEAAGAGLPIVATDVGGNASIVQPGKTGLLVTAGDAPALAEAMLYMADEKARLLFGEHARQWAKENAAIIVTAERYRKLYLHAAGGVTAPLPTA